MGHCTFRYTLVIYGAFGVFCSLCRFGAEQRRLESNKEAGVDQHPS